MVPQFRFHGCGSGPSRPSRTAFAALMAAGIMALPGCRAQSASDIPTIMHVKGYLAKAPMGLAEENDEPNDYPLNGTVAACRGVSRCTVEVRPGDLFLNLRFDPQRDGNMEISVISAGGESIGLERRIDFEGGSQTYDYQTLAVGRESVIFNTDLRVRAEKDGWRFFLVIH